MEQTRGWSKRLSNDQYLPRNTPRKMLGSRFDCTAKVHFSQAHTESETHTAQRSTNTSLAPTPWTWRHLRCHGLWFIDCCACIWVATPIKTQRHVRPQDGGLSLAPVSKRVEEVSLKIRVFVAVASCLSNALCLSCVAMEESTSLSNGELNGLGFNIPQVGAGVASNFNGQDLMQKRALGMYAGYGDMNSARSFSQHPSGLVDGLGAGAFNQVCVYAGGTRRIVVHHLFLCGKKIVYNYGALV